MSGYIKQALQGLFDTTTKQLRGFVDGNNAELGAFPITLAQAAIPVILPPTTGTNTINSAGVIVLVGITLPTLYGPCWVYLMAGDVVGGAEGLYYAVHTNNTTNANIQVYTNFVAPTAAFTPFIPSNPVAAVGKNLALTSNISADKTLANVTVPGGLMGANGALRVANRQSNNNSAGAKVMRQYLGVSGFVNSNVTTSVGAFITGEVRNRGLSSQVTGAYAISNAATALFSAINTAIDQPLTFTGNLAVATDYIVLEGFTVEVLPCA